MTEATSPNGQFEFLNALRKGRAVVTLYLVNGIRLQGRIASFDRYAVLLQSRDGEVLIQNHAISTIGRDAGHGARRPREAGERPAGRPPRPSQEPRPGQEPRYGHESRIGQEPHGEPRVRAHRPVDPGGHADPAAPAAEREATPAEPRRTVPTVTIVRKGLRRVRVPGSTDPQ